MLVDRVTELQPKLRRVLDTLEGEFGPVREAASQAPSQAAKEAEGAE